MTKYAIVKLAKGCPFCGEKPLKNMPVFEVSGPWSGTACAFHLATLIGPEKYEDEKPNLFHEKAG